MNDLLLKFVLSYLTDKNIHAIVDPYKVQLCAQLEAAAKKSPEIYDDILVKFVKVILGVA